MAASNKVPSFLPSTSGFHFDNDFPSGSNYPVITLPVVGTIASQDASNGLCGGFVFTVLDLWLASPALQPPADTSAPSDPSPLFDYLSTRLLDSLGQSSAWANAAKVIAWVATPSHDTQFPAVTGCGLTSDGLGHRMVFDEWPKIKADIDAGKPSPLSLVGSPECGVGNVTDIVTALHHCHQVLAYAYTLDDQHNLTLWVYDPNDHDDDNVTIAMNIGDPAHTIAITAASIVANLGGGLTIRGIFRPDYTPKDASAIAGVPHVAFTTPASGATLAGTITLGIQAANVYDVAVSAWYGTNPNDASTVAWHALGSAQPSPGRRNGLWSLTVDTTTIPDQGNAGWGTVKFTAFGHDHRAVTYTNVEDDRIVTIKNTVAPAVPKSMTARVTAPAIPLPLGSPVTFTVQATDGTSGAAVAGQVKIDGAVVGNTGAPITFTFTEKTAVTTQTTPVPRIGPNGQPVPSTTPTTVVTTTLHSFPKGTVSAPGYADVAVDFGYKDTSTSTTQRFPAQVTNPAHP